MKLSRPIRRRHVLTGIATLSWFPAAAEAQVREHNTFFDRLFGGFGQPVSRRNASYGGKKVVDYRSSEKPGTIVINTRERTLYLVRPGGKAIAYGIGVGRDGFRWSGRAKVGRKAEWPAWHPPKEMIERELAQYGRQLPERMEGGPNNPLGARALYLYAGGKDTLYRIHGTNQPQTIGQALSSGCIRMLNEEVIDLYDRVDINTAVVVQ
ncbi:MAG: L,D-transpeptidase [Anderseniella sp.]|jgi:lipoprotein-anchoring transpeptidase ErfK/SrfK|nr:L,D-transpeptidase [Anderseniella sp.]